MACISPPMMNSVALGFLTSTISSVDELIARKKILNPLMRPFLRFKSGKFHWSSMAELLRGTTCTEVGGPVGAESRDRESDIEKQELL